MILALRTGDQLYQWSGLGQLPPQLASPCVYTAYN